MMTISLAHYLVLGAILFATGVVGVFLNRKNVIVLLMAIEAYLPIEGAFSIEKGILRVLAWALSRSLRRR